MEKILSQHEAVVQATKSILGEMFIEGTDVKEYITKDQRYAVIDMVTNMLATGEADLSVEARAKFDTPAKLRSYTNGLVCNWFNKSKHLNGGVKYETKNPGSRAGSGDEQIKALKALRSNVMAKGGNTEALAKIDEAINARMAVISETTPVKLKDINIDALPTELRDLV